MGGVDQVDWRRLAGRDVWACPDADRKRYGPNEDGAGAPGPLAEQPGMKAAMQIAAKLHGVARGMVIVRPPGSLYGQSMVFTK